MSSILPGRGEEDGGMDEQFRRQLHGQGVGGAAHPAEERDPAYFEETIDTGLEAETIQLLDNLLAKDFPLANFTEAGAHEFRWLSRVIKKKLVDLHPPEKSVVQGEFRKFLLDDPRGGLQALDAAERLEIDELTMGAIARATRGRSGWQQEQFDKKIAVSEVREQEQDDGGWFA